MRPKKFSTALLCITAAVVIGVAFMPVPGHAQDAATIYSQNCVSCHGAQGKGDGAAAKYINPKPTDFAVSLKGKTDDWIARAIKKGGPGVGEAAVMPAYPKLSDAQIHALVEYVKHLGH